MLWLRIIRPGTLAAGIAPVAVGLASAARISPLKPLTAAVTALTAIALQVLANLINDYYDFRSGRDCAGRSGPRRALAEGEVSLTGMENAIIVTLILAAGGGIFLVAQGGAPVLIIGLLSLLFAWLYTATPFSLAGLGIADLFVFAFFGPVAAAGTAYLQTGSFLPAAAWAGTANGLISMAILTVNNLRDEDADRRAGKRTIVVRFGRTFGRCEYLSLFVLSVPGIYSAGSIQGLAAVPAGIVLSIFVFRAEGRKYNRLLVLTGLVNILYAALFIAECCVTR
jgi:1,4-dihydroxy-2-naphthoate octaprenyltransferase